MRPKFGYAKALILGMILGMGNASLSTLIECPGCQSGTWPDCGPDDNKCSSPTPYCVGTVCRQCKETPHCSGCEWCNNYSCAASGFEMWVGSDVICVGGDVDAACTATPDCQRGVSMLFPGAIIDAGGCLRRSCYYMVHYNTPGEYTISATCGVSPDRTTQALSRTITVVGVGSVTSDKTAVCYNDSQGILFTAHSTPANKPMNCIAWNCWYREKPEDAWRDLGGGYTGQSTLRLYPGAYLGTGYYKVGAKNGEHDWVMSPVVKVVQVNLEAMSNTECSPLPAGQICSNAQACCRKAKWKATVKPVGTTATVFSTGPAFFVSNCIVDGEELEVGCADSSSVGDYTLTITHNDCGDCPVTKGERVFKFINTDLEEGTTTKVKDEGDGVCDLEDKAVKADNPTPGGQNASAGIHTPYYFKILTDPSGVYTGNVKAIVTIDVSANYDIKIKKLAQPPSPITTSISIDFMWLTYSETWTGTGNNSYGAAAATTDSKITFGDKTDLCSQFTKNHKDFPDPLGFGWGEKTWSDSLEHTLGFTALEKPTMTVGVNNPIGWEIAVSSAVEEDDSVLVPYNRCYQSNIDCEIRDYEIPTP